MQRKNRVILAVAIVAVIVLAVLSSFLLPAASENIPKVVLPDFSAPTPTDGAQGGDWWYERVEVTPDTVQNVIATLDRVTSYSRLLTVETLIAPGQYGVSEVAVWVDGGYTRVEALLPNGLRQIYMVGDGQVFLWYEGDQSYVRWEGDERAADLAQHIPTYEDVLALDKESITSAGYEMKNGMACVYVEARNEELGYLERYWVEVSSRLLVACETGKGEEVVLRMTAAAIQAPLLPQEADFTLPDGTVLHEMTAPQQ